jgi:hypothetical protein|uniref:Uncharacterized protein n=1 Tax=Siphoviridae sp. ct2QJ10 TaxID=2825315 RepID=A0A8S5P8Y7_9CAUD|nr:MAG TPA: hypothetical protein [Siphoviridae sp. ct2QJ10]
MVKAKNMVIAGDYLNQPVSSLFGIVSIDRGFGKEHTAINKETVENYELITDEHRKSAKSGVARGLVGGALLGPVGMLAGGLSAKSKGIFIVAIAFKDGRRSLIEVDNKIYKAIVTSCF